MVILCSVQADSTTDYEKYTQKQEFIVEPLPPFA
jgi:hypothetical protein